VTGGYRDRRQTAAALAIGQTVRVDFRRSGAKATFSLAGGSGQNNRRRSAAAPAGRFAVESFDGGR